MEDEEPAFGADVYHACNRPFVVVWLIPRRTTPPIQICYVQVGLRFDGQSGNVHRRVALPKSEAIKIVMLNKQDGERAYVLKA